MSFLASKTKPVFPAKKCPECKKNWPDRKFAEVDDGIETDRANPIFRLRAGARVRPVQSYLQRKCQQAKQTLVTRSRKSSDDEEKGKDDDEGQVKENEDRTELKIFRNGLNCQF